MVFRVVRLRTILIIAWAAVCDPVRLRRDEHHTGGLYAKRMAAFAQGWRPHLLYDTPNSRVVLVSLLCIRDDGDVSASEEDLERGMLVRKCHAVGQHAIERLAMRDAEAHTDFRQRSNQEAVWSAV